MPKHIVKCLYCSESFNANEEPYIKVNRRYAHQHCAEEHENNKSQEEKDREKLEEYIKQLLQLEYITPRIRTQIKNYLTNYNYTYSGILKALKYFYEIKGNSTEKANEGIGIVPYCYQDAYNYYFSIWIAQESNREKNVEAYKPEVIEITIKEPVRKIKKRKLFCFLEEEE